MKALVIVKDLNVLKDIRFCLPTGNVVTVMNQLRLECGKETLHRCVIVDIARAAHAGERLVAAQQMLVACTGVLATSV